MATFNPALIDFKYIYDVYQLMKKTPESEDLMIAMAKLDDERGVIRTAEERKEMLDFIGRPQSKMKVDGRYYDRQQALARIEDKGWEAFEKACQEFMKEDLEERAANGKPTAR